MKALYLLPLIAVLSIFLFPWPLVFVLALLGSYVFAPTALIMGVLVDAIYAPSGLFHATMAGFVVTLLALGVQAFVKRNIIGG